MERISELFEDLCMDTICKEISNGSLKEFISCWKAQMGREIDNLYENAQYDAFEEIRDFANKKLEQV